MLFGNPEFQKNLKLEFSWGRVLIALFVLGLTAWIGWNIGGKDSWIRTPVIYEKAQSMTFWLFGYGFIFSIIWGAYLASNSLFSELRQKTWDFVRMSSLSPQRILCGKIFGATSTIWLVTLVGVIPLILYASQNLFLTGSAGYHRPVWQTLSSLSLSMIFWMTLSYSASLLFIAYYANREMRHSNFSFLLIVLIGGLFIGGFISASYIEEFRIYSACNAIDSIKTAPPPAIGTDCLQGSFPFEGQNYKAGNPGKNNWYNLKLYGLDFAALLLGFAAFWSLIGAFRTLQNALLYKIRPVIWPVFITTSALFLNGATYNPRFSVTGYCFIIVILTIAIIAPTCVKEARNKIQYKLLINNLKSGNLTEAFRLTPLWVISFASMIVLLPVMFAISGVSPESYQNKIDQLFAFYISLILFVVRDIIAIHVITWQKSIRRQAIGIGLYIIILYFFVPVVVSIIQSSVFGGSLYFYPILPEPYRELTGSYPENLAPRPDMTIYLILQISLIALFSIPLVRGFKKIMKDDD